MNMEYRWSNTDYGTQQYSELNLPQGGSVHQNSHSDWPGIEHESPQWVAGD